MNDHQHTLSAMWHDFARDVLSPHATTANAIYETIVNGVADDSHLLDLVLAAPPSAHWPLPLLAAVHMLVLGEPMSPLAQRYADETTADPFPLFRQLCLDRRHEVAELMATRHIQTNECGRCAVLGPALTWLASGTDRPLARVDVGASAGLTLLADRYLLDYGSAGSTGPGDAAVTIECEVRSGRAPISSTLPTLVAAIGLDRAPIDLTDDADSQWLLACVWPGSPRLARTAAAIAEARTHPPDVRRGHAVDDLPAIVATLPDEAVVVVTTSLVAGYFDADTRVAFDEGLAALSMDRPVVWVSMEDPGVVPGLGQALDSGPASTSLLGASVYANGRIKRHLLGHCQAHGSWLEWQEGLEWQEA